MGKWAGRRAVHLSTGRSDALPAVELNLGNALLAEVDVIAAVGGRGPETHRLADEGFANAELVAAHFDLALVLHLTHPVLWRVLNGG